METNPQKHNQAKAAEAMSNIDYEAIYSAIEDTEPPIVCSKYMNSSGCAVERLKRFINSHHFASVAREKGMIDVNSDEYLFAVNQSLKNLSGSSMIDCHNMNQLTQKLKAKDDEIAGLKAAKSYKNVLKRDNNALREKLKAATGRLDDAMHIIVSYERGTNEEITDAALKNLRKQIADERESTTSKEGAV